MFMLVSGIFLFLFVIFIFLILVLDLGVLVVSIKIFNLNFLGDLEILLNVWSLLFSLMVVIISSSVLIFSCSYMSGLMVNNFMFLYLSFIVSMLWLILMNNFYWMMFGWDGLGVVSFLLIIFYMNYESANNGLFTLFQNRIGDLFFVLFMVGVFNMMMWNSLLLKWGILFLILGACVKSAQFPFNSWLLAAMSAPTPISSLVHSSTLVVAGVYILLQFSYCLTEFLNVLQIISMLTLFISSFGLINEFDMKKLIAYSTMSHVSLMMYLVSFKLYKIVYSHLNIHAMFKSLMFMCFGFVMLASFHSQDKRLVLFVFMNPMIKMVFYLSCLCLGGLPFLSGFFSKDLIIEKSMEFNDEFLFVFLLILFLSISIYYSIKLLKLSELLFSLVIIEKSWVGMFSVLIMSFVMIIFINIYISLIFSVTLEILSFKLVVYLFVFIFLLLSLYTNLNFKFINFDKFKSFNEIWFLDYYSLDKFFFWNMFNLVKYVSMLNSVKFFLVMNWWVIILSIVIF